MRAALQSHWPEYLIEALGLGTFMVSICLFGTLLWHPSSPASLAITEGVPKRFLMGLAMGLTLMAIVYSPWGKRSGAHINPAFTLTMWQLGQIPTWDAIFYVAAQFAGALAGVWLSTLLLGGMPAVLSYFVTVPGEAGPWVAAAAEFLMCFLLMVVVLAMSSRPRLAPWTGAALGALIALYVVVFVPYSGMSLNPARTFGSALPAGIWTDAWLYYVVPPVAMLSAAKLYLAMFPATISSNGEVAPQVD